MKLLPGLLDRSIARQLTINVVALLAILFCFIIVIDISLNVDRFLGIARERIERSTGEQSPGLFRTLGLTGWLIADLWGPRVLSLYNTLIGMVLTAAMAFTCVQMVRHRELVAMLAGGRALHSVLRPVFLVCALFLGLAIVNQELLLPRVAPLLTRDHGDAGSRELGVLEAPLSADGAGRVWRAGSFDADAELLHDVWVLERADNGLGERRITADTAAWDDGAWVLQNVEIDQRVDDLPSTADGPPSIAARTILPSLRIQTDMDPTALRMRRFAGYAENLSTWRLGSMLAWGDRLNDRLADRVERIRTGRYASMLGSVLAMLIVVPFFLVREPRDMVVQSVKAAPIAIAALFGAVLGTSIEIPGVPPMLSACVPVLVLLPLAITRVTAIRS